jgi:hypothetical protein
LRLKFYPVPEETENATNVTIEGPENKIAGVVTLAPTQVPVNNITSPPTPLLDSVNSSCTAEAIDAHGKNKCKVNC